MGTEKQGGLDREAGTETRTNEQGGREQRDRNRTQTERQKQEKGTRTKGH